MTKALEQVVADVVADAMQAMKRPPAVLSEDLMRVGGEVADAPAHRTTAGVVEAVLVVQESQQHAGLLLEDGSVVVLSFDQCVLLRNVFRSWLSAFYGNDPEFVAQMRQLDAAEGWSYAGPADASVRIPT